MKYPLLLYFYQVYHIQSGTSMPRILEIDTDTQYILSGIASKKKVPLIILQDFYILFFSDLRNLPNSALVLF